MNAVPRLLLLLLPLAAALPVHGFPKKHPVTDRMRRGGWAPSAGEARTTPTTPPAAAASDSIEEGEEQGGEEAGEEEDDGEGGGSPCVIVVDPMDVNGRRFCDELREWGVEAIPVLSPAVAARLEEDFDDDEEEEEENPLAQLTAPAPGEELAWAAARGMFPGTSPPLAALSESDAGIETALRLEMASLTDAPTGHTSVMKAKSCRALLPEPAAKLVLPRARRVCPVCG